MYGVHQPWRGWDLRFNGVAFVQALYEPRDRHRTGGPGTKQVGSVNWDKVASVSRVVSLIAIDHDLAATAHAGGCRRCAGRLPHGDYPRKPRGGPATLPAAYEWRTSFCRARCRKRLTPPSVRFLGRRVYLGAVVVLGCVLRQGPTPWRVARVRDLHGVSADTLARWHRWWRDAFVRTARCLQNAMATIGRNDPCPCASGQQYKRCCWPRDDAAAAERARARERDQAAATSFADDDDGLDEASNRVIDLIDAGRLDEAEQAAQDLLARYPEVHDGLERVAMVAAARGDRARAAEYYRKAADFVHARPEWYDSEMEIYLRERATEFSATAD